MKHIDIFYQGEGIADIQHLEIPANATFGDLRSQLTSHHNLQPDTMLFVENDEQPVDATEHVGTRSGSKGVTVHAHRCRRVNAVVTFNNKTEEHLFPPASTIAHVKQWIAVHKFDMTKDDAGEHVLQMAGTQIRPPPSTHIGALTDGLKCSVAFDLVANERVNGSIK